MAMSQTNQPTRSNNTSDNKSIDSPISEDEYFIHGLNFLQKNKSRLRRSPVYKGVKAPAGKQGLHQRSVLFNVLDVDMDGKLGLKEFFELIKY